MMLRVIVSFSMIALLCVVSANAQVFQQDWNEQPLTTTGSNMNIYYGGGIFDGEFYTGRINCSAQKWDEDQIYLLEDGVTPTAQANGFTPEDNIGAKSSILLGNYIFYGDGNGASGIGRVDNDWESNPTVRVTPTSRQVVCDSLATDGTYIYSDEYAVLNGTRNRALLHKWEVTNSADSFTLAEPTSGPWVGGVNTTATGRIRAVSYYDGKLYCGDHDDIATGGSGDRMFEIDVATGTVTTLGIHAASGLYQAVRYGDELFVTDDKSDSVTVYTFDTGGNLLTSNPIVLDLGLGDLYGIGVSGDGTTATGFWVNSINYNISRYSVLDGDANRDGRVDVSDLGILATNYGAATGKGWIEADFTGNGGVDVSDLGILATNYGTDINTAAAVPEPSMFIGLLGLCLAGLLATARRRYA